MPQFQITLLTFYFVIKGLKFDFHLLCHLFSLSLSAPDNPGLLSHVPVTVQVLDVNDNPPEIATDEEVIVCESSRPGQVSV